MDSLSRHAPARRGDRGDAVTLATRLLYALATFHVGRSRGKYKIAASASGATWEVLRIC